MSEQTKVCSKCETVKNISDFSKHKLGKNGLRPSCKDCQKKANLAAYLAKNPNAKTRDNSQKAKTKAQRQKEYMKRNPLSQLMLRNKWKKSRQNLSGSYVRSLLGIPNCPQEIVELKRDQIKLLRITKQLKQELTNV